MYYYDTESRRQHCREHIAQMRDEYQRVQAAPRDDSQPRRSAAYVRSMWWRMRRRSAQRAPAYWA
jgi:predicted aminopeptidase